MAAPTISQPNFPGGLVKPGELGVLFWLKADGTVVFVNDTTPLPVSASVTATSAATATAVAPTYVEGTSNPVSQDLKGNQRVTTPGTPNAPVSIVTSAGVAATLFIARPTRVGAVVRNTHASNVVAIGPVGITFATGFPLKGGESLPIPFTGLYQVIDDNTNHADVAVLDCYN